MCIAVTNECVNKESYGEISVRCNACGRFDEVKTMENECKEVRPDYESECRRLLEKNEALKCKLELLNGDFETLQLDNRSLERERNGLNKMLEDANREIAHLRGQVKAFEFCVAKGK